MAGEGENSGMGNGLYTPEQVELFELVYHQCQNPSEAQRLEMINEHPYLSNLESKDIKLWFQNRRRHEKQKKWDMERMTLKDKLSATKQLLLAENDRLQQELLQLENEYEYIQRLLQNASSSTTDIPESEYNPVSLEADNNPTRSVLLAEESHTELLTVSKQSTIGWFPTPRMKALHCFVQLIEEKSGKLRNKDTFLLSVCQQSTRGLNGDGRSLMNNAAAESLIMAMNSIKKLGTISSFTAATSFPGDFLCVKVSLLLKKLDNSKFKIATGGEINVEEAKCDKQDMVIAKSTKNLEDNLAVQCHKAPVMPASTEASVLADWICKSFRSIKGGMLLKSNVQNQESVWKGPWYIKFQGYAVFLAGICKSGGQSKVI